MWSLGQGSHSGSRACKPRVWPCSYPGWAVQHPVGQFWEPAPALQGKDMGVTGVRPSKCQCGIWISVTGRLGLGSVVGIPASAHSYRRPGPYPSQNDDWDGDSLT